jgi:hypothetical protein
MSLAAIGNWNIKKSFFNMLTTAIPGGFVALSTDNFATHDLD